MLAVLCGNPGIIRNWTVASVSNLWECSCTSRDAGSFSRGDSLDKNMVVMMGWCGVSDIHGAYCMETVKEVKERCGEL